jgi:hypothetical protein
VISVFAGLGPALDKLLLVFGDGVYSNFHGVPSGRRYAKGSGSGRASHSAYSSSVIGRTRSSIWMLGRSLVSVSIDTDSTSSHSSRVKN